MLDIDNFKSINDTLGHRAGDSILRSAANLLRDCIGESGLIARYGGDEFCIVLDTSDPVKLKETAAKIRGCVDYFNTNSNHPP
jgi:diguanylate cyclase (GGDEF)-like protein